MLDEFKKIILYALNIYDMTEEYKESFFIGIFSSFEKAEQIAKAMLEKVSGFKDYDCKYEISEKSIVGTKERNNKVYLIWGWNEDGSGNPMDIIESDLYINHNEAEVNLPIFQEKYMRQEWCMDCYKVDEVLHQDGFVKVFYTEEQRDHE